jgi:hypothetical protein
MTWKPAASLKIHDDKTNVLEVLMATVASKSAAQGEQNEDGSFESETSSNSSYASSSDGGTRFEGSEARQSPLQRS